MLSRMAGVAEGSSSTDPAGTRAIEAAPIEPTTKTTTRTGDAGIRCMVLSQTFAVSTFVRDEFKLFGQGCKSKWFFRGKTAFKAPAPLRPCKFFHLEVGRLRLPLLFSLRMASLDQLPRSTRSQPQLERGLGLKEAVALNMIEIVGIGPFVVSSLVIKSMGGPQALLAWLAGALLACLDGFVWSELGAAM